MLFRKLPLPSSTPLYPRQDWNHHHCSCWHTWACPGRGWRGWGWWRWRCPPAQECDLWSVWVPDSEKYLHNRQATPYRGLQKCDYSRYKENGGYHVSLGRIVISRNVFISNVIICWPLQSHFRYTWSVVTQLSVKRYAIIFCSHNTSLSPFPMWSNLIL